jgi:hypothetical protein
MTIYKAATECRDTNGLGIRRAEWTWAPNAYLTVPDLRWSRFHCKAWESGNEFFAEDWTVVPEPSEETG